MRVSWTFLLISLIKLICLTPDVNANEVLGCGGFIKSHAEIDFSKVEVKLFTKQGALKDKTDCSPSNGYYFLPIYDKGQYLLRIAPPPGWSFEPEQVELHFDGKSDICSQGKDVNFAFKGFGITGKVALAGHVGGARGVGVELKSEDGKDVRRTVTDLNGIFSFTPIIPGKYVISASHAKWHFTKAEHTVVVVSGNTELPENSLVVSGFDVTGRLETNGQLSAGVGVAVFRKKGQNLPLKCTKSSIATTLSVPQPDYETSAVCYAQVDSSGAYTFSGLAPGKYLVQPVVENSKLKIHISPKFLEFEVAKDTLELKNEFKITGSSVSGRVLAATGGEPLASAIVKLNGQKVTETNSDGSYLLENIKPGTYTVHVEAPQHQFNEHRVKIELATPVLSDIVPDAYEVCGKVVSKKSYVVGITKHGSTFHTTAATKAETGEWCTYLPPGKFTLEVLTTSQDKAGGVQFFPVQQNIDVAGQPLSGITFSQLRATLTGQVKCLPDAPKTCTAAEITLHTLDAVGQQTGQKQSVHAQNGKYTFREILPGPYEITIPQSNLCFDSTRVFINIATATETSLPFVQRGYEVSIISSHRAIMKYTFITGIAQQQQTKPAVDTLKLLDGVNTFCVPKFGSYSIKLESCHLYDESLPRTFTTTETQPLIITATAHKVGVRVLSPEPTSDSLELLVESASLGQQVITPAAETHKVDNQFAYRFETHLKPEEVLRITPRSDILLFNPQSKDIVGTNDCVDIAFNFIATRGLILRGKVVPAIKDAQITLSFPNNPELAAQTTVTGVTGEFKFGPIDENLQFELLGEKESYVFSEYNRQTASFSVHKLCEILVRVKDQGGKTLSGVLLSLSGAESYRKNLVTGENGEINFHSLSPSQYYLRPMMKEYKFEPNSKMIDIKDGETVEVELVGKRVAYSVFGSITSLNGDPFGQVSVEAIADETCMHQQEEAISESNGQYRIRGLQPGCAYTVRVKTSDSVERSLPKSHTVNIAKDDVRNVNLIAISPINFVDVTARVTTTSNDHYKTLRIVLYRKGASDSPIYSQRVETPLNAKSRYNPGILVFFPRIPLDGKTYVVELKSTLSDKTYTYVMPVEQFVANHSSIFVQLDFKPEIRTAETDLNQNSISALVLVALVAIAFFKQDIAMDFLNFVWSRVSHIAHDMAQKQKALNKKDTRKQESISQKEIEQMAEQINAIKRKKTKKI